jgi:hypothetical protein
MLKLEKCGYCGEVVDLGDPEIVQEHGGEGGFAHLGCIQQVAEELVETERTIARSA